MSLKSLGIATLGLLKRGLKESLHIATFGLLRTDDEDITGIPKPDNYIQPGRMLTGDFSQPIDFTDNNNIILLLTLNDVL